MSELAAALVASLADLSVIDRGRTATIPTKSGGQFTYSYADLGDVVTATRSALAAHDVVALTPVSGREGGLQVAVVLLHKNGERMDFDPLHFPASHDPQAVGSTITYYRRYALLAALGIATGDDDDGAAGSAAASRPKPEPLVEPAGPEKVCTVCDKPLGTEPVGKYGNGWAHKRCAS
jgi:hypothetical protein